MSEQFMQQFRDQAARLQAAKDGIAADIAELKALIGSGGDGGLDAAQTAEALALVTALADQFSALDAENPAPPVP